MSKLYKHQLMQDAVAATGNGNAFRITGPEDHWSTFDAQITGSFTATVTFEATLGTSETQASNTWVAIPAENVTTGAVATTATAAGVYRMNVLGYTWVRARVTWSSGTSVTIKGQAACYSTDTPALAGSIAGTVVVSSVTALTDSIDGAGAPVVDSYSTKVIDLAASTADQELVAAPGASKQIWVYGLFMMADTAAGTVTLQDSDNTALSGTMAVSDEGGWVLPISGNFAMPWIKVTTNKALEADTGACTVDGILAYAIVSV